MKIVLTALAGAAMASSMAFAVDDGVPEGFVDLERFIPGLMVEARYAGTDNFIGSPIDGYDAPKVIVSQEAANALKSVQEQLTSLGYSLKVFDGYRPQRAVDHFMRWIKDKTDRKNKQVYYPSVSKGRLVSDGYIAEKSGHSRGSTVDITVMQVLPDGTRVELDMGSPWDYFGSISSPFSGEVSEDARANRMMLRMQMIAAGFKPYEAEWWHFTLTDEPYPDTYFDFPIE